MPLNYYNFLKVQLIFMLKYEYSMRFLKMPKNKNIKLSKIFIVYIFFMEIKEESIKFQYIPIKLHLESYKL